MRRRGGAGSASLWRRWALWAIVQALHHTRMSISSYGLHISNSLGIKLRIVEDMGMQSAWKARQPTSAMPRSLEAAEGSLCVRFSCTHAKRPCCAQPVHAGCRLICM